MLIEVEDLNTNLEQEEIILLYSQLEPIGMPQGDSGVPCFIPNSRIFDVEEFSDKESPLPHTLLNAMVFTEKSRQLGINAESKIVVYDNVGIYSSPRVWFNLKFMGCKDVSVVNGGLKCWQQSGFNVSSETCQNNSFGNFQAQNETDMVASKEYVQRKMFCETSQIVDLRSEDRFLGKVPEPRQGVRRGHIPNAVNIPFPKFLNEQRFRKKEELRKIFEEAGSLEKEEIIFLCGSGVTACIGYFAASLCGISGIKVYDGSWAEWGSLEVLPIENE